MSSQVNGARFCPSGRLTKLKGRVVSIAPGMLASASVLALSASGAMAADITTATTTPFELGTDEDLNVTSSGSVIASGAAQDEAVGLGTGGYSSTFTNRGTLRYSTTAGDPSGVRFKGDLSGSFLNFGTTAANSTSTGIAYALRLDANLAATGLIENAGTLEASATNTGAANAYGVDFDSALSGAFSNSGTITSRTVSPTAFAYSYGIVAGVVDAGASVANAGTIAVLTDSGNFEQARGMSLSTIQGDVRNTGHIGMTSESVTPNSVRQVGIRTNTVSSTGSVTNAGTITLSSSALAASTGSLLGIRTTTVQGSVSNTGTIDISGGFQFGRALGIETGTIQTTAELRNGGTVVGNVTTAGSVSAYGLSTGSINGRLTNTGLIDVTASSGGYLYINGLHSTTISSTGIVRNSGTMRVVADASSGTFASAYGLSTGDVAGSVANTGTVSVTATAASDGSAFGISTGSVTGTLNNSGSVTASITGSGIVRSSGVSVSGSLTDFSNTGTIAASSAGGASTVDAYGVRVSGNHTGTLTNAGRIEARATGGTSGDAYGVLINGTSNGVIENTGFISGRSEIGTGYSIYAPSGTGTINLRAEGDVDGTIRVDGHDVNMFANPGQSKTLTFEDSDTGTGTFTTDTSTGALWFSSGAGGATPVYATVDMSAVAAEQQAAAEFANLGWRRQSSILLDALDTSLQTASFSFLAPQSPEAQAPRFYIPQRSGFAFAELTSTTASGSEVSENRMTTRSLQAGIVDVTQNGTAWLLTAGGIDARSTNVSGGVTSQRTDIKGAFVGTEFAHRLGMYQVTYGARAGIQENDSERYLNLGGETATADYDSKWINAAIGVSRSIAISSGARLVPHARISHTSYSADGYTETGSSADASVKRRSGRTTDLTVGADYIKALENGIFRIGFDLTSRKSSGQDPVGVTVLGATQDFDSNPFDANFGTVSIGYTTQFENGLKLDLAAQLALGSDDYRSKAVTAKLSMTF